MTEFHIPTKIGIGDLLFTKDFVLNFFNNKNQKVIIHLPGKAQNNFFNQWNRFYPKFLNKLFSEDWINFCPDSKLTAAKAGQIAVYKNPVRGSLLKRYDLKDHIKLNNLSPHITPKKKHPKIANNYAVLHTRLKIINWDLDPSKYEKEILKFRSWSKIALEILCDNYEYVVVIGEKKHKIDRSKIIYNRFRHLVPDLKGYSTPSIYSALIKQIESKSNIIDLTTHDLDINTFEKENQIIEEANKYVVFGGGGNYCRGLYLNGDFCCLMDKSHANFPYIKLIKEKGFPIYNWYNSKELSTFFQQIKKQGKVNTKHDTSL